MSRVPIRMTHAFMNGTTLELNKKKMKTKFIECNENIPKALGVPTILTTDISLSFYADPLDTTKYKAYVKQFRASVTYRGQNHECEPPWIYSSYDLAACHHKVFSLPNKPTLQSCSLSVWLVCSIMAALTRSHPKTVLTFSNVANCWFGPWVSLRMKTEIASERIR